MADYEFRPGGSLKLKGADNGGVKKKKKAKTSTKTSTPGSTERVKDVLLNGKRSESPAVREPAAGSSGGGDKKTDAERRFEETQRRRLEQKVAKLAKTSHKDRVSDFNSKLEALSEHHDIPKVGPG